MTVPMLQLENVVVDFDGFKAIDDLSLTIESGSMTVVIGPNGAGKSTMCDSIIGRVRPASGRVLVHGAEIQAEREHAIVGGGICRQFQGSEERRVGKECVSTCRSQGSALY